MLKLMIKGWKNRKLGIILIMLGLVVEIVVFSIGIGQCTDQYVAVKDKYAGLPSKQTVISADFEQHDKGNDNSYMQEFVNEISALGDVWLSGTREFTYNNGVCTMKESNEIDFTDSENVTLDDILKQDTEKDKEQQSVSILPVKIGNGGWQLPILTGNYWSGKREEDRNTVIIGKGIAEKLNLPVGAELFFEGTAYKIIGISGRENRTLSTDAYIFVNFDDVFDEWKNNIFEDQQLELILKQKVSQTEIQNVLQDSSISNVVKYHVEPLSKQMDYSALRNTIFVVVVSVSMILIIVIINIVNVMKLWLGERSKEFKVLIMVGATKKMLIRWIRCEVMIMAIASVVISCVIELIMKIFFNVFINLDFANILLSTIFALLCANISIVGMMKTFNEWNPLGE